MAQRTDYEIDADFTTGVVSPHAYDVCLSINGFMLFILLAETEMTTEETDLVAKHLEELKSFTDRRVATRFEVVAKRGWLPNLFSPSEPWIEIRWIDDEHLQLDLMALKPTLPMPDAWERKSESTWVIPMAQTATLAEWVNREWRHARGSTSKTLRMWTD